MSAVRPALLTVAKQTLFSAMAALETLQGMGGQHVSMALKRSSANLVLGQCLAHLLSCRRSCVSLIHRMTLTL